MTSIRWEELEFLKSWDMTDMILEELELEDLKDFDMTTKMWEEMHDFKDAIFFVDLDRDHSIFYNPAIASELGGYIHIRGKMDNSVYSYHVNYNTIVPSSMPSPVLSTSHVSMWEFGLEADHGEATVDSKQEEDDEMEQNQISSGSEQNQISSGSICDKLPPLSAKYPWLVVQNAEDDFGDQLLYTIHDPLSQYHCRIPELLGRRIRGCFHGWLILSSHPHNVLWFLWNPVTSKVICLPPLMLKDGDYKSIGECCLSSPMDGPSSVLLLTRTDKSSFVFCRLDRNRRKLRWTEMSYAKQLKRVTLKGQLLYSLTSCDGKVYALSSDGFTNIVVQVDIQVNDREVVIKLLLFGACPLPTYQRCCDWIHFLKGSTTELFYIRLGFHEETKEIPFYVYLFKLDMTSIKWEELEFLKSWDMTDMILEELELEDFKDFEVTTEMWKEMRDLKDAIFFVDLDRDRSIFYNPAVASELGGYIHIRGKMDNSVYSHHVNYNTIVPSSMPSPVLSTSHVSMWEFGLEADHGEATVDSKQEEDDEVKTCESHLLNIPIDVLGMIIECCAGVEYMNFRATCKQCYLAAPSKQWGNEIELKRLRNYSLVSPWLMVVETYRDIFTFIDPILGDNYYIKHSQVSSIAEGIIHCSRFGWVLFESIEFECLVLLNPFTNDLRKLPEPDYYLEGLCFSAPPTSPDCMVVGFAIGQWHAHIHYVAREQMWRTFRLGVDLTSIRLPTFYGRDLYALCNFGDVVYFKNLGSEDYSVKIFQAKAPGNCCKSEARYYLMKCDQHLLLVIVDRYGKSVEVFKHNDSTEDWEKIRDLGKRMIYICGTSCICIDAHTPEVANKIYFPNQHSTNGKIVFYSLETCLFHTFDGKNIQETLGDLYRTVHQRNPLAWIEPSWS